MNPTKVYLFECHDPKAKPPTKFSVAIADQFELETLILYSGTNGLCMDSSWRHKNENRAPLTMVATVNNEEHFVPGAAYLSEDVKTETLARFLQETKNRVEEYCRAVVKDPTLIQHDNPAAVLEAAQSILDNPMGWIPKWFMIDKDLASVKAILEVWPDAIIRICQFHVIQAILRWHTDSGGNLEEGDNRRPRLSHHEKRQMLVAFRSLQRCRSADAWDQATQLFLATLRTIAGDGAKFRAVKNYFESNWFTPFWRRLWTDMGLPLSMTRDAAMLNTNNWIERAFKTIDQTFLDCRANKRMDRLVIILAEEFFPFYRVWEPKDPTRNADLIKDVRHAHRLWSTPGMVQETEDDLWAVASFRDAVVAAEFDKVMKNMIDDEDPGPDSEAEPEAEAYEDAEQIFHNQFILEDVPPM
ncbi:hypothetical protein AURDEDRAFT_174552 [Auricularia subglabra TFB-10046 SS5]|uniref:MULE transposase domain-containing protein n=1 Tax=Auricularia subglabra (strain TFB-10046 / SS5) TaxID=717982 RepID=J0LFY2_AURST|nr:hypothetical protein AURDEDRAFT_174552 [Auricularia subglabra TFB-10046 SS5]